MYCNMISQELVFVYTCLLAGWYDVMLQQTALPHTVTPLYSIFK